MKVVKRCERNVFGGNCKIFKIGRLTRGYQAKDKFGRIDVVFANAGHGQTKVAGLEKGDPDEWKTSSTLISTALLFYCKASLPH